MASPIPGTLSSAVSAHIDGAIAAVPKDKRGALEIQAGKAGASASVGWHVSSRWDVGAFGGWAPKDGWNAGAKARFTW